jgi:hypothetical protein
MPSRSSSGHRRRSAITGRFINPTGAVHVLPEPGYRGWRLHLLDSRSPFARCATWEGAVDLARGWLQAHGGGEARVHDTDGRITHLVTVP